MIVPANPYLLGVLNSKIADYYIRTLGVTRNGGYFEYKPMFIEQLPVPQISEDAQKDISDLVHLIIKKKKTGQDTSNEENSIESVLYCLYDFNEEEINYIKSL